MLALMRRCGVAEAPQKADEMTLIIDVGTNAEIVVGNKDRLLAASSPTGPAFEGAKFHQDSAPRLVRLIESALTKIHLNRNSALSVLTFGQMKTGLMQPLKKPVLPAFVGRVLSKFLARCILLA